MGSCQNYGRFLGTLSIRCRIIIGIQEGTIILTTTHIHFKGSHKTVQGLGVISPRVTTIGEINTAELFIMAKCHLDELRSTFPAELNGHGAPS